MMQSWTDDMIRFMKDASEYQNSGRRFHQELAMILMRHLNPDWRILDAGCGLGHLSMALSPYVCHVTAVDICPRATDVLRGMVKESGTGNVSVYCADAENLSASRPFDAAVFNRFGDIRGILRLSRLVHDGVVLIVKRDSERRQFSTGHEMCDPLHGIGASIAELRARGIPYESEEFELSLDQPLRDISDARLFLKTYNYDPLAEITDPLVRQAVRPTGRPDFPYIIPAKCNYRLIKVKTRDIPE